MDDYVAAVTVAVAAYRRRKQTIKNINQLTLVLGLLDEEDAIVSREHIYSFCNVRRAAVMSSVCRYVCMVITYSRVLINRVRLPVLLVVS